MLSRIDLRGGGTDSDRDTYQAIGSLLSDRNYPCIAAIRSFAHGDFVVGSYPGFGSGRSSQDIAQDLKYFLKKQASSQSSYFTYFAQFKGGDDLTESEFENALWHELSCIASLSGASWDPTFSDNPEDKNFCFSFEGKAFFVVGLHPNASRKARKFRQPLLIFNLYDQFKQLMIEGKYDAMVKVNREKDRKFQGSVNPMAEKYAESWESIQFSGSENPSNWKCPFQHGAIPAAVESK